MQICKLRIAPDDVAAVKLILRCRLENDGFKPLPGDRELALEAAERCQQQELARSLRTIL